MLNCLQQADYMPHLATTCFCLCQARNGFHISKSLRETKKIQSQVYCVAHKNDMKFKCQCPWIKCDWHTAALFIFASSVAVWGLLWQKLSSCNRPFDSHSQKYYIYCLCLEEKVPPPQCAAWQKVHGLGNPADPGLGRSSLCHLAFHVWKIEIITHSYY